MYPTPSIRVQRNKALTRDPLLIILLWVGIIGLWGFVGWAVYSEWSFRDDIRSLHEAIVSE